MSNEDNSEDRLTKNEFCELIQHLSMQEILSIEYLGSSEWAKLFSRKNMSFTCNLCVVDTSSFRNLLDHINGKRHKLEMENVKELYHPDYTYPKSNEQKITVDNSSESNQNCSSTLASFTGSGCNYREASSKKCIQTKSSVKNREIQSNKNNVKNRNIIEIKPTILTSHNSLKTLSNDNKKKEIMTEQNKCKEHFLIDADDKEQKTSESSIKGKGINKDLQKDYNNSNVEKIVNSAQQKHSNIETSKNALQFANDKNNIPEINLNLTASNLSLCEEASKGNTYCSSKLNTEDDVRKLIVSAESKNCQGMVEEVKVILDSKNNKGFNSKTAKIVINPAAAIASKKNSLNLIEERNCVEEKPKYQTDKIITPSANKNMVRDEKKSPLYTSQTRLSDLPIFSVKSYSSKSEDMDVNGILGVEYVIKILKHKNDSSPRFECGLCELVLDGFAMQRHLEGYNHRLKFCEKHFPTAIRHYRQYMQNVPEHEIFKVMTPVLEKLAKAIESHHGRNLPYECYERDFSLNRHEILAKAFSCRHASEQHGPTFIHVVGADEIDGYINRRQNYAPPTGSRYTVFDIKPGSSIVRPDSTRHQEISNTEKDVVSRDRNRHAGQIGNCLNKDKVNSRKSYMSSKLFDDLYVPRNVYDQSNRGGILDHVDDKTYNLMVDNFLKDTLKGLSGSSRLREYQKRSASPCSGLNSKKRKSLSPLRDNDIWQAYRHMCDQELNNLDEKFKQYRKDPEAHPSYNDEWQKFWKRRKDELISAGLDHRNYNYQPEWVKFIKFRTEELYNEEVEKIKINCRKRLCLPMTNSPLLDIKYHVQFPTTLNENFNTPIRGDVHPIARFVPTLDSLKINVPQVVSVLRLMAVLEDSLGSLGPKIIDLLSKALQAEKLNPTLVNAIILTDEHCSLIETAKEKFKGLLITGLLEGTKEKVLQQVINDTEDLLKYAYKNREFLSSERNSNSTLFMQNSVSLTERPLNKSSISSTENLLLSKDKKELASKLAASLVAQGKTDFDPQQLQQLLAVYSLIEKKKRGSSSFSPSKETAAISKKKLSETLSDLLKSSSTSTQNTVSVDRHTSSSFNVSQQKNFSNTKAINTSSKTSFESALQNSSDNCLINATLPQLPESASGINTVRGNQLELDKDYNSSYSNNSTPYPQTYYRNNTYNNDLYQTNNRIAQNWMLKPNMEMNSNYQFGRPSSYNQPTNWRNF